MIIFLEDHHLSNVGNEMALKKDDDNKLFHLPPSLSSSKVAKLLSDPPFGHNPSDFETWVERVEREPSETARVIATQFYVVYHEEEDPVSSQLYRLVGGTPPPGVHYYIGETLTFIALAAASGVVGNLTYDALKRIVNHFLTPESKITFEEKNLV